MNHNNIYQKIEHLAYRLWEERGRPTGSPDEDWFRAERRLHVEEDAELPFGAMAFGPLEY